jgi:putative component of membrane protein insertase Oxa1/YidC/SpoIIIJ protein YidD
MADDEHLLNTKYEGYVKSKFRYKIYVAMNDVTPMLYVSLVRQFKTFVKPYCHSSLLHRPHALACEYRLVGYSWPVEIEWLHRSHSRWDFQCTSPYLNDSSFLLLLATTIKTWRTLRECLRNNCVHVQPSCDLYAWHSGDSFDITYVVCFLLGEIKRCHVFLVVLTLDRMYLKCLHWIGRNGALEY